MKAIFTTPKINKSGAWYVYFYFNKKQFRYKSGLNTIKDLEQREHEANFLCGFYHKKLLSGWNPETPDIIKQQSIYSFNEALDFAMEKKLPNLSKSTASSYNGTIRFIKVAVNKLTFENLKVIDVKRVHIKLIIEKATELNKWSNNAHNRHLNHLKAILSELLQWNILETNPAHHIKNLPVAAPDANHPASKEDMAKIRTELENNHYNFYVFCITIFFTGIRPEEILKIKLSMVNLKNNEIVLPPEITKTNKKRVVPISPFLLPYYQSMQFDNLPKNYYLFGSFKEAGKGNTGKNQLLKDFIPAPTHINRDTATKRWERIVKIKLGIDMNLYAMKKAGANALILANTSINAIKDLFGHTSEVTTQIYITKLKELNRQEILDKSTDF